MAKLTLSDLANLQNESSAVSTLSTNNLAITTAMENTLSRDGTSPNTMLADLDMNSNQILNLPTPTVDNDPVTKGYADDAYGNALEHANDAAASATAAATSATNAATSETNASTSATAAAASATLAAATIGDRYTWTTSTSGDPGSGKIGVNNATPSLATALNISETDVDANNLAAWIATWDDSTSINKAVVTIEKTSSPAAVWAMYFITALTDNGAYDTLTASYITGAGSFTNGDAVTVGAILIGNKGTDGSMTGPGVSVDSEVALYSGTSGTALKRASATGIAKLTSGVLGTATSGTDYAPATSGTSILKGNGSGGFSSASAGTDYQAADAQLFSNIPQQSKSADYTLVLTDAQRHIYHPAADTNNRTFTIPANASVAFPIGTTVTFVNMINTVTIAITTDTMYLMGTGTTGSRTLAAKGIATALKTGTTEWVISGSGLT